MQNKLITFTLCFLFIGCTLSQEERNKNALINAVYDCIDSGAFPQKIIAVYKTRLSYDGYDLYYVGKYYGIDIEEKMPYEVRKIRDKYVFFFSRDMDYQLSEREVIEIENAVGDDDKESNTGFYFAQCKTGSKNLLIHAVNDNIEPYEIPEIRNFSCFNISADVDDIEIISTKYSFDALDEFVIEGDTIHNFPLNYDAYLAVYNRSDSCLFFGEPTDSLGYFAIVNGKDTLFLNTQKVHLTSMLIDDPTYKEDLQRIARFYVSSDVDTAFFKSIELKEYHQNLRCLLRDSLFYFSNVEQYNRYVDKTCIFPKKNIKVITPVEAVYIFNTPTYLYRCIDDFVFSKEEKR